MIADGTPLPGADQHHRRRPSTAPICHCRASMRTAISEDQAVFRKVVQAIISRWRPGAPAGQGKTVSTIPATIEEPPTPSAVDAIEERLADMADDNHRLLNGDLHHISLEEVRDALGEDWDSLSLQVTAFAAHQLQRWLGHADCFRPHANEGFLIQFDDLEKDDGDQRAKRAALRLKAELVRQFPQIADASRGPAAGQPPNPAAAQETMAKRLEMVGERVRRAQDNGRGIERGMWRSALGQATLDLLEADTAVTIEALVGQLEARKGSGDLILRSASTGAAIERLRKMPPGSGGSNGRS